MMVRPPAFLACSPLPAVLARLPVVSPALLARLEAGSLGIVSLRRSSDFSLPLPNAFEIPDLASAVSCVGGMQAARALRTVRQANVVGRGGCAGDRGAQRTRTNEAPTLPDFTEYLRQAKLWHDVLRTEEGESSSPCAQAAGRRARADSADRCQTDTSALASIERDVAAIFFQPDFDASDTTTFLRACPLGERSEAHLAAELTKQLDLVRT